MAGTAVLDLDDLKRILREGAGENRNLDGDVLDTEFEELGYDSIALLETATRISREYGVTLDDDVVTFARSPRQLLDAVNGAAT